MEQPDTTHLKPGDLAGIAKALNVTPGAVSQVVGGTSSSTRIVYAINTLNAARKKETDEGLGQLCKSIREEALTDFNQTQKS